MLIVWTGGTKIDFPEDPPDAVRMFIMSLYGFELYEIDYELDTMRPRVIVLVDTYDLATKYLFEELATDVLEQLEAEFSSMIYDRFQADGSYWQLAAYLLENHDRASPVRAMMPRMLQSNLHMLYGKGKIVWEALEGVPELAIMLLGNGGMDGKGWILDDE